MSRGLLLAPAPGSMGAFPTTAMMAVLEYRLCSPAWVLNLLGENFVPQQLHKIRQPGGSECFVGAPILKVNSPANTEGRVSVTEMAVSLTGSDQSTFKIGLPGLTCFAPACDIHGVVLVFGGRSLTSGIHVFDVLSDLDNHILAVFRLRGPGLLWH